MSQEGGTAVPPDLPPASAEPGRGSGLAIGGNSVALPNYFTLRYVLHLATAVLCYLTLPLPYTSEGNIIDLLCTAPHSFQSCS